MGGRCRRRGNATRHTDFARGFRSIRRGVARRSSWMGADGISQPDPKLASEGDGDDGRETTWRCGARAVGNCRRMIAPGGRRALRLAPDHHRRSPCSLSSRPSSSRAVVVLGDALGCDFWAQFCAPMRYKLLGFPPTSPEYIVSLELDELVVAPGAFPTTRAMFSMMRRMGSRNISASRMRRGELLRCHLHPPNPPCPATSYPFPPLASSGLLVRELRTSFPFPR